MPLHLNSEKRQMRIAKAVREGKFRLVQSLQWPLTHSLYGRLWAIRRVVTKKDDTMPGVDGFVWNTPKKKMQDVNRLKRIKEYIWF
jgi:RNA-directed DNA polymerase